MNYYAQFRAILRYRLWDAIPRKYRLVAHIESEQFHTTRCGQSLDRMTVVHQTVAAAIGADDCKACAR